MVKTQFNWSTCCRNSSNRARHFESFWKNLVNFILNHSFDYNSQTDRQIFFMLGRKYHFRQLQATEGCTIHLWEWIHTSYWQMLSIIVWVVAHWFKSEQFITIWQSSFQLCYNIIQYLEVYLFVFWHQWISALFMVASG